jgi:hypothetical protein
MVAICRIARSSLHGCTRSVAECLCWRCKGSGFRADVGDR